MNMLKSKAGQVGIGQVGSVVLGAAIAVIIGAITVVILSSIRSGQTADSLEYNITTSGMTLLKNVFDQFGTVGTILGAAVLLGSVGLIGAGAYMGYQYVKNR